MSFSNNRFMITVSVCKLFALKILQVFKKINGFFFMKILGNDVIFAAKMMAWHWSLNFETVDQIVIRFTFAKIIISLQKKLTVETKISLQIMKMSKKKHRSSNKSK